MTRMEKALIAMSGGVDSSLAAALMQKEGYDCLGVTMLLLPDENEDLRFEYGCIAENEARAAKNVADVLGIEHHTVRMKADFEKLVIEPFVCGYRSGLTPNPCVECNRHIKFSSLDEYSVSEGCSLLVTGHYARTQRDMSNGQVYLVRADDKKKDQTYFLWTLTSEKLKRIRFPIGELTKDEVRALAEELSLPTAKKKDSQDICFVKTDYADFIKRYTGEPFRSGDYVDKSGALLGKHSGIENYTIGQRKGLGIALGEPMYVIGKDAESNRVILGKNEDLFTKSVSARNTSLCVRYDEISDGMRVSAKIRYNQPPVPGRLFLIEKDRVRIEFDESVRAVCPGQSLVFYSDDIVLGGGIIEL